MGLKEILEKYGVYSDELYKEIKKETYIPLNLKSLTKTEKIACQKVLAALGTRDEGALIISKFADECGMTRSSIISALKKLEEAAAIKTTSLGMKGTYIKIINNELRSKICEENGN